MLAAFPRCIAMLIRCARKPPALRSPVTSTNFTLGLNAPYYEYDLEKAEEHFADFIKKYERKYESATEFRKRFEIFKRKLKKINEWNRNNEHTDVWYAITQFSDEENLKSCVNPSGIRNTTKVIEVEKKFILNAPDELDYRTSNLVTEVKNQGECKDCFIFAAVGNIESMHAKNSGGDLQSLSEQQVLDCTDADCVTGGFPVNAMNNMAGKSLMAETDYPYEREKKQCRADPNKGKVKVNGGSVINTQDIETLKGALVQNGAPLAVSMEAPDSLQQVHGPGVYSPTDCKGQGANHAVLLIGYGKDAASGKDYWLFKNSWGTTVGDNGFFRLDMTVPCSFGLRDTCTADVV